LNARAHPACTPCLSVVIHGLNTPLLLLTTSDRFRLLRDYCTGENNKSEQQ